MNVLTWQRWVMGFLCGSIGTAIALEMGPSVWSLSLGMIVGFVLGYFGQNPRELWPALKQACLQACEKVRSEEGRITIRFCFWWSVLSLVIASDFFLLSWGLYGHGTFDWIKLLLGLITGFGFMVVYIFANLGSDPPITPMLREMSSVLFVPTLVFWHIPRATWVGLQLIAMVLYFFLKMIHSNDRVLFGSYMALGVWVGFFNGSVLIGGVAAIVLAEVVGRRLLRPILAVFRELDESV